MDKEKTHYANLIRYIIEHGGSASQDELDEIAAAKNPKNKDRKPNAAWYLKKRSTGKDKRNYGKYFTQNQDGKWSVTDKGKEYYKVRNEELTHINQRTTANVATFDHISDYDSIIFKRPSDGKPSANVVSLNRILVLSQKYPDMASLDNMKNTTDEIRKAIGGCNCTWYWATLRYLYEMIEKGDDNTTENIKKDTRKNFVFLIDEINRGDMSKIFGELFFSIDPGYRGVNGKINTQYQNMLESSCDEFEKGFYIPENVYIIGTMNDIDRSVESLDFAMRRRFQFIEVTAEDRAEGMKLKEKKEGEDGYKETEAYKRMTNLNNCIISEDIGLSTAYQIGGAYFLKKHIPIEGSIAFKNLWDYRLEGLLREYLRGEDDKIIKDKIEKLRKAFELTRLYELKDGKWVGSEKKSENSDEVTKAETDD